MMQSTPSGTPEADGPLLETLRYGAPFTTKHLLLAGIFLAVVGVAIIAIANAWRLTSLGARVGWILALGAGFLVLEAFTLAAVALAEEIANGLHYFALSLGSLLIVNISYGVIFALIVARPQRWEYSAWIAAHGQREPTFRERGGWPAIKELALATLVVGFLIWFFGFAFIKLIAVPTVAAAVIPDTVFSDPAFELTYSGRWHEVNPNVVWGQACWEVECVVDLYRDDTKVLVMVMRTSPALERMTSLENLAAFIRSPVMLPIGVWVAQEPTNLTVGGQTALQMVFRSELRDLFTLVTRQPDESILLILARMPAGTSEDAIRDVEAIIASIRFK